ncbi:MAG: hypothetical protein PF638_13650 [Candidatus Delongbacteria bacterium]|nr:hypothetical protein [Candidatus Delongbacteria bacterium]
MYKIILSLFLTLFLFSCATTNSNIKLNKFMDPDTGVETVESIIAFHNNLEEDLISFNQTKNPQNISWYIIGKFCPKIKNEFTSLNLIIDAKSNIIEVGGSYNSYDVKTQNSNIFRKIDYFKINERIIADLNKSKSIQLEFKNDTESENFFFNKEQLAAVKNWVKNITIPK